jgi:F-type H+-transporting ATPase subunit b
MIEINLFLLVTQIATFLAAMVIVWKLFWGPLTRFMQERSQKIAADLQKAESGRHEIEALEGEYHRRLEAVEAQARQQIQEALARGAQAKEQLLEEARTEAKRILEKAEKDLAQEREKVLRELRAQMTDLSLAAVERLLGQGLDQQVQRRLLDQFVQDVEKLRPLS